ncbi:MAG: UTP--glucose-1-phosphate uridylyltransferase, partial [Thermogemmatispora sp.]
TPCLPQLMAIHERYGGSVVALAPVPDELIPSYGIAAVEELGEQALRITHLVEKPPREQAPSNLAVMGRYLLTPDIFPLLEETPPGSGGEIQVTDALEHQAREGRCYGLRFTGTYYDTGTRLGLLTTTITYALKRPDLAPDLRAFLRQALQEAEG